MTMSHVAVVVGVLGITGAQIPAVQEPAAQLAPESSPNPLLVSQGKNPFGNIFIRPGTQPDVSRSAGPSGDPQPRIICGMIVVPVNPAADPKMVVSPKPASKVEYKIRVLSPRVCRE